MTETVPSTDERDFALQLEGSVKDERTGALWVHKDFEQVRKDWEIEDHIGPIKASEQFGDVESWARYVSLYGVAAPFLTWNSQGLCAVIDYHEDVGKAGRCQWTARHPFVRSPEWRGWESFANGSAVSQRDAIEKLEDLGEDIRQPLEVDLLKLLRDLRANATATADTEIRPDGTTAVSFSKDTSVGSKQGEVELPPIIKIAIPVLVGDPILTEVRVRMRATVGDNAKLTFRFSFINAERTLEAVYTERVNQAQTLLGEDLVFMRSAG